MRRLTIGYSRTADAMVRAVVSFGIAADNQHLASIGGPITPRATKHAQCPLHWIDPSSTLSYVKRADSVCSGQRKSWHSRFRLVPDRIEDRDVRKNKGRG